MTTNNALQDKVSSLQAQAAELQAKANEIQASLMVYTSSAAFVAAVKKDKEINDICWNEKIGVLHTYGGNDFLNATPKELFGNRIPAVPAVPSCPAGACSDCREGYEEIILSLVKDKANWMMEEGWWTGHVHCVKLRRLVVEKVGGERNFSQGRYSATLRRLVNRQCLEQDGRSLNTSYKIKNG